MKFVLEISESEKKAIKQAGRDVKNAFKKIADSFQVRVVEDKKGKRRKK